MRTEKVRSKFRFFKRFEIKMTHSFDIVCVCFTVSSLLKTFRSAISFVLNYSLIKVKFQLSLGSCAPTVPLPATKMSSSPPQ